MGTPIRPPHRPTQTDNCLASPQHQLYPCHIYICTQRHSLWASRKIPSTHLLLSSSSHPVLSSQGKEAVAPAWPAHLPGSVEWSYVDIRNLGSNVCPWGPTVPLRLVNGWVHHPTVNYFSFEDAWTMQRRRTLSIQNPPLRSIISKNASYSGLRNQSKRAISKLLQK